MHLKLKKAYALNVFILRQKKATSKKQKEHAMGEQSWQPEAVAFSRKKYKL